MTPQDMPPMMRLWSQRGSSTHSVGQGVDMWVGGGAQEGTQDVTRDSLEVLSTGHAQGESYTACIIVMMVVKTGYVGWVGSEVR